MVGPIDDFGLLIMDQYAGLIAVLQQHAQRFFEIWNFQIVISVAVLGFVFSKEGIATRDRMRVNITILFMLIAMFSVYTLSVHNKHETLLWYAIQSRVDANPEQFTSAEIQYLDSIKPTPFLFKAVALVMADLLVILITWISPYVQRSTKEDQLTR
jgi:hypothetical protein